MILTLLYFLGALILLVTVHEYGHFLMARCCGVKVLRFSFGFGPVIARWQSKKGTEYAYSLFPLGGYVKMLDESEGYVSEQEKHQAFNNQSFLVKTAIVIAGPLFNFIFAFAALWLISVIGMYSLAPIVDQVKPHTIAAQAGFRPHEEILALNDTPINTWRSLQYAMMPYLGSQETIDLTVRSLKTGKTNVRSLSLKEWTMDDKKPDLLMSLGIIPFTPTIPPIIGEVVQGSPAQRAGLNIGDKILSMDGKTLTDWGFLVEYVRKHPNTLIKLVIKRQNKPLEINVHTAIQGNHEGFIGVRSQKPNWPKNWFRLEKQDSITALATAAKQTVQLTKTTFILMGRLVTGKLGLKSISGPVGIAQGAGDSGRGGLVPYLMFLSLVSISLGVLNLMPIPMLDGGHLLYYVIEFIIRKPLSESVKSVGLYLGMVLLVALMVLSLSNDISRLSG